MLRLPLVGFKPAARLLSMGCLCWAGLFSAAAEGANIIVDHTNWDWYVSQPQTVTNAVAMQKIYFAHASVGANVLSGLADLHGSDPIKYPLTEVGEDGTPPATVVNGTVYEYDRGNPDWSIKVSDFATYINNGWHSPKVNMVMNKFCFIDQTAGWASYRDSLVALEAANPGTKFIYWTMPLRTDSDSDEVLRAQFNQNLRAWIATQNNKLLFDIADIEAWDPSGVHQTFVYSGLPYEQQFSGFSADGGHLNQTGYDRVATGLYSLFGLAATSSQPTPTATPAATANPSATARPNLTPDVGTAGEWRAYPNPALHQINFAIPATAGGEIGIRVFNISGELVGRLKATAVSGQRGQVAWDCADLGSGIYLAEVSLGKQKKATLKFAVRR